MTIFQQDRLPHDRGDRPIRRWLALAFTAVAFSVPIAGVFLMVWPVLLWRASLDPGSIELLCAVAATILIGTTMASCVHRGRWMRP